MGGDGHEVKSILEDDEGESGVEGRPEKKRTVNMCIKYRAELRKTEQVQRG